MHCFENSLGSLAAGCMGLRGYASRARSWMPGKPQQLLVEMGKKKKKKDHISVNLWTAKITAYASVFSYWKHMKAIARQENSALQFMEVSHCRNPKGCWNISDMYKVIRRLQRRCHWDQHQMKTSVHPRLLSMNGHENKHVQIWVGAVLHTRDMSKKEMFQAYTCIQKVLS